MPGFLILAHIAEYMCRMGGHEASFTASASSCPPSDSGPLLPFGSPQAPKCERGEDCHDDSGVIVSPERAMYGGKPTKATSLVALHKLNRDYFHSPKTLSRLR